MSELYQPYSTWILIQNIGRHLCESRVLPQPPLPMSVSKLVFLRSAPISTISFSRPHERGQLTGQVVRYVADCQSDLNGGKSAGNSWMANLKHLLCALPSHEADVRPYP